MYASFGCGESWSTNQGYLLFLLDRLITSETFHDVQIAVAWATWGGGGGRRGVVYFPPPRSEGESTGTIGTSLTHYQKY